jgi:hypothetical protein
MAILDIDDDELSAPHGVGFVYGAPSFGICTGPLLLRTVTTIYHGTGGNNMATQW